MHPPVSPELALVSLDVHLNELFSSERWCEFFFAATRPPVSTPSQQKVFTVHNFSISNIDIPSVIETASTAGSVSFTIPAIDFTLTGPWSRIANSSWQSGNLSIRLHDVRIVAGLMAEKDGIYLRDIALSNCVSSSAGPLTDFAITMLPSFDARSLPLSLSLRFPRFPTKGNQTALANEIETSIRSSIAADPDGYACAGVTDQVTAYIWYYSIVSYNGFVTTMLTSGYPGPLNYSFSGAGDFPDNRDSPLLDFASYAFNNLTGMTGPLNLNEIGRLLTNGTGTLLTKALVLEGANNFSIMIPIGDWNITVGLRGDGAIEGLNTWRDFFALRMSSAHLIDTHTSLTKLGINGTMFFNISTNESWTHVEFWTDIFISDGVLNFQFQLVSEPGIACSSLPSRFFSPLLSFSTHENSTFTANWTNSQCFNLSCLAKFLNPNETAVTWTTLNTTFSRLALRLNTGGSIEDDLVVALNGFAKLVFDNIKVQLAPLVTGAVSLAGLPLLNPLISDTLAETECPVLQDVVPTEVPATAVAPSFGSAGVLFVAIAAVPAVMLIAKRRAHKKLTEGQADEPAYECECTPRLKEFGRLDSKGASLMMDQRIHWAVRIIMPLLLLGNIALFISSNASIGAAVEILFTLGTDKTVKTPSLFNFGLINSIRDMWKAGIWPLSILVALFSGVWPYIKLIMMLVAWVFPLSMIPEKHRERILMVLDALGKWSMLDTYIMVLFLVSFHFHVALPAADPSRVTSPIVVDVFVTAASGFLMFVLATVISLVLSHIILALHRHVKARRDENEGIEAKEWRSLFTFCSPKKFVVPVRIGIAVALGIALALVVVGVSIVSFAFHFYGLAGWALELLGGETERRYSVFTVGAAVTTSVQSITFTVVFTQIIFFLTAAVLPIVHLVVLIFLWLVPLTRRIQSRIYVACEVLYAWASLDVFVLSLVAAILEIGQFTEFMVGEGCASFDPYIGRFLDEPLDGHTGCFVVEASLEPGCWVMITAVVIYTVCMMVVMRVCRHSLEQRKQKSGAAQPDSPAIVSLEDTDIITVS